jgi:hypothetical protein
VTAVWHHHFGQCQNACFWFLAIECQIWHFGPVPHSFMQVFSLIPF